jgi:hypothetical protein
LCDPQRDGTSGGHAALESRVMSIEELEAAILELDPKSRARLVRKILESLDNLSREENEGLWLEEAQARDAELDRDPGAGRPAADVFRGARAKLP